jgi:diguanylate cyclase (GGDEF)-like protein/PAS domain S-box-containing protein
MTKDVLHNLRSTSVPEKKWPTFLELEQLSEPSGFTGGHNAFRTLIENLPVMCYAAEPNPPYAPIYSSPALETFGYSLDEWRTNAGMWLKAIHPDDRDRVVAETNAARLAGEEVDYEYRLVARDGATYWVRDRGRFLKDANGKLVCWLGIMMDVTDRKVTEECLRESEELYRKVFEDANDIIYIHDLKGNYISVNRAAEKILGYPLNEALSMNMLQIMAPDHIELVEEMLKAKLSGKTSKTEYEVDCITKDGRRVTLEVNSSVIFKDGKPIGVQGIARDITERKQVEEALRKSEKQFRELFENSSDLIYTHDMRGYVTSINRATERVIGYTREESSRMNVNQVIAPEMLEFAREMTNRKIAGEQVTAYELELISKDGKRIPVELSTRLIVKDGVPIGVQGNARDITERKIAEDSLRETVSLLTSTLESSNDGIVVVSPEHEIVVHNQRFLEMWHIPPHIIEQRHSRVVLDFVKDQMKDPDQFIESTLSLYKSPLDVWTDILEFNDGRAYERYSQPQYLDGNPVGRVVSFRDITERRRSEEKLRHNALHDPLTNLPNRAQFMEHLKNAIDRAEENSLARFAVLFLDLDRFKVVNDSLGHFVGDDLLISIAERLKTCVRPGDIVARLGGDEFTILLNRTGGSDDVVHVAERLQNKLSQPFRIGDYEVVTTTSVGIIMSDGVRREPEDFLRDADAAMYRAKATGKAHYEIFDRDMYVRNMNLLQVETDLRQAIEREEFEVFYQPIVLLENGMVREFEALIRWRHPKHGLVTPSEFIEVAEETGLIITIGRIAIEESCRRIAEWQKRVSFPLSVSVNLSARQLMNSSLTTQVEEILRKTGLAKRQLKLEVTETTVMENSERSLRVLSELEKLGVSLSTDDFGTGYSSLSYLHRFPFSRLKIDQSFIKRMDECMKSRAIVKTILALGQNLGIEVVAEGIETKGQFHSIRDLGCRLGQGYFFSKPVDAETAGRLLFGADDGQTSPAFFNQDNTSNSLISSK